MTDQADQARTALEEVCARGDLMRARELYASDFIDHVNALEFRGQEGIARSVAMYRALFPDLRIDVVDQVPRDRQRRFPPPAANSRRDAGYIGGRDPRANAQYVASASVGVHARVPQLRRRSASFAPGAAETSAGRSSET
jgi:hypothetical protein